MSFAIVVARFYEHLADRLVGGAQTAFADAGAGEADVFAVPGAFELPLAARYVAQSGRYDGVACLGAVIRGETAHFEYVCQSVTDGLTRVALDASTPVGHGVLTVDTIGQARARAGLPGSAEDKGWEATIAALATALTLRGLRTPQRATGFSASPDGVLRDGRL